MSEQDKTLIRDESDRQPARGRFVAGAVLADRYRIVGLLGEGGMGQVFKAEDLKLGQTVALKFLPDKLEADNDALARFHAEVRTARQVSHPNVCRVFDIGETEGRHFISMEFVDGDDLSSLLRRVGRIPSDKAIEISRQICAGLHAVHQAGILHRDLKPANIIVDSRGVARITDFGIAGLESELKNAGGIAGTPAYMSPEQITGKALTAKSDIYSLGLLLYEIFTGKQALQFDSIPELIKKHQTETPTNPSEILSGIDPLVERTILHCLEKNPDDRPKNALQVAMMLPGGNPLEAAIAAGETPSPEMVAAAPKKGALKPAVAVACLAGVVALFAFIVFFSGKVKLHEWVPLDKPPEVLAERADTILKNVGYDATPVDSDFGFGGLAGSYFRYSQSDPSPDRWERLRSGQPAVIYFWHRTSPRYLEPLKDETVSPDDPPSDIAGMTKVILDTRGRLLEFQIVPPQVRNRTEQSGDADWKQVFAEAGLDIRGYLQSESNWTSPVFADASFTWDGPHVDHPEIPVRIEAASFNGKPVYFQVIAPWDQPRRPVQISGASSAWAPRVIGLLFMLSVIVAATFLARRNLRLGRSDNKAAFKITIFVFGVGLTASLLIADHVPDFLGELNIIYEGIAFPLLSSAVLGLAYIALEPYVRRHWASLMISWTRLLNGDFRDPLVGRDILIGGIFGLGHTAATYLMFLSQYWTGPPIRPDFFLRLSFLQGFKYSLSELLSGSVGGIFFALFYSLFLILLVMIFRKRWLAIIAVWTMFSLYWGSAYGGSAGSWNFWLGAGLIGAVITVGVARFGLLAIASGSIFYLMTHINVITFDTSSWYFSNTIFAAVVIFGLAIYGFYISLAGQPVFQSKLLDDEKIS